MPQSSIRFEEFELDIESCELRRTGPPLRLQRIPNGVADSAATESGKLVRRQTIEQRVWDGGSFLETEHSINTAINKLRVTLRGDSRDPRFMRTIIGQGYSFIAEVKTTEPVERSNALLAPWMEM